MRYLTIPYHPETALIHVVGLSYTRTMTLCPECRDGKCRNCDGRAWDLRVDDFTDCECSHDAIPETHVVGEVD